MLKFVLLASFLVGAYGAPPLHTMTHNEERIIGGDATEITSIPWQAAALYDGAGVGSYLIRCGGSIISQTAILTAAHCVDGTNVNLWRIRVGSKYFSSGGDVVQVSKFKVNEAYNDKMDYDIAIIWLASPLTLNGNTVKAIALPKQGDTVADGTPAMMSGWGSTTGMGGYASILRRTIIPIINQEACATVYELTGRMICAGNFEVSCNGDKGGPLVVQNVLIGISSWGRSCAQKGYPGVYSRVSSMMNWVEQQLG